MSSSTNIEELQQDRHDDDPKKKPMHQSQRSQTCHLEPGSMEIVHEEVHDANPDAIRVAS
jgi:hypothetical protein